MEADIAIGTRQDSSMDNEDLSKETVTPSSGWKEKLKNFCLSLEDKSRKYLKVFAELAFRKWNANTSSK